MGSAELTVLRNEWSQSAEAADQRRYWVERLAPPWRSLSEEPTSRFTSPKSASLVDRFRTRTCRRKLDPPAIEAVRRASVAHGLTEFMMLLSAYATTLQRWSGQRDMRIATLVANRTQPGTEDVVGLLANTLVLRMDVDDPDPAVVARRVREVCLDAFDRQELAFEDVLAALQDRYSEETRQGPLFEAMLVMQDGTRDATADEGLRFSAYASEDGVLGTPVSPSTCDFILAATPARGELVLDLIYKPATTSNTVAAQILNDIAVTAVTMAHAMGVDR